MPRSDRLQRQRRIDGHAVAAIVPLIALFPAWLVSVAAFWWVIVQFVYIPFPLFAAVVLLLGSLLGLELIGKVPPTLHTPLMSGANAISGITVLASLSLIANAKDNPALLLLGALSLGFALFNVIGGFLVTDRMLAMFSRKPSASKTAKTTAEVGR